MPTPRDTLADTAELVKARAFNLTTQCDAEKIFDQLCRIRDDINDAFDEYRLAKDAERKTEIEQLRAKVHGPR